MDDRLPTRSDVLLLSKPSRESHFPIDDRLRRNGFRLMDRPAKGPVIWTRDRKEFTQQEAIRNCTKA